MDIFEQNALSGTRANFPLKEETHRANDARIDAKRRRSLSARLENLSLPFTGLSGR